MDDSVSRGTSKDPAILSSVLPRMVSRRLGSKSVCKRPRLRRELSEAAANMADTFSLNLLQKSCYVGVPSFDHRLVQLPFQATTMALHMSQVNQAESHPLLDGMNSRDEDSLRSMVRQSLLYPLTNSQKIETAEDSKVGKGSIATIKILKANALYLLSVLLLDDQSKCFLHLDMLNVLMVLIAALPTITYPDEETAFFLGKEVR